MDPTDPASETPLEESALTPTEAAPETEAVGTAEASADATPGAPEEALARLVASAANGRLSAAEESEAAAVLKDLLLSGKSGVATAALALPKLAWMVGVSGVTAAWPEMKPTAKTQLIKALTEDETDAGRRIRLSLARGLHKLQDLPTALKLGVAVAKELRDAETGDLSIRNAQLFANVFIGKAKPWCGQLPLAELKSADADALVHCALLAAFALPHPPVTQLGVIKWAAESGRLAKLPEIVLAAVTKGLARWSAKWQGALRKEVAEVPEEILAALKPAEETSESEPATEEGESSPDTSGENADSSDSDTDDDDDATPRRERPVYVSKTMPPREQREQREQRAPQEAQPPRERGVSARSPQFNIGDALRQIDAHVAWLRSEIKNAESKARPRDDDARRGRRKPEATVIEGDPSTEELARVNVQLEARIAELQSRLDDLAADSEARAASTGALSDAPPPSPDDQLRGLLALKLQENYGDFHALEQESRDLVARQHYRTLLREVFEVLKNEGIVLEPPPEENPR